VVLDFVVDADNMYWGRSQGYKALQYRNRFRMSFESLEELIRLCRNRKWFPDRDGNMDALRRESSPLELLIMGSLAYMAGSISF
jgi:hypothetical protein